MWAIVGRSSVPYRLLGSHANFYFGDWGKAIPYQVGVIRSKINLITPPSYFSQFTSAIENASSRGESMDKFSVNPTKCMSVHNAYCVRCAYIRGQWSVLYPMRTCAIYHALKVSHTRRHMRNAHARPHARTRTTILWASSREHSHVDVALGKHTVQFQALSRKWVCDMRHDPPLLRAFWTVRQTSRKVHASSYCDGQTQRRRSKFNRESLHYCSSKVNISVDRIRQERKHMLCMNYRDV